MAAAPSVSCLWEGWQGQESTKPGFREERVPVCPDSTHPHVCPQRSPETPYHITPGYTLPSFPWGSLFPTLPLPTPLLGTFSHLPHCHKQLRFRELFPRKPKKKKNSSIRVNFNRKAVAPEAQAPGCSSGLHPQGTDASRT